MKTHEWFYSILLTITNMKYTQGETDHTMFVKHSAEGKVAILIVYIDGIILTRDYTITNELIEELQNLG